MKGINKVKKWSMMINLKISGIICSINKMLKECALVFKTGTFFHGMVTMISSQSCYQIHVRSKADEFAPDY